MSRRREGDAISIPGDYQAQALQSPRAAQRFWHAAKLRAIDRLAPPRAGARIADAGCGSGVIAAHVASTACAVTGFDASAAAVEYATRTFGSERLRFVCGPFEVMVDEGPFDQIYCLEVLEHLYEEQAVDTLRTFRLAAAPGAELFVTTPNARSAWPAIEWTLDRLALVPRLDEVQHLTLFSRHTLRRAIETAGWRVDDIGSFNGIAPFVAPVGERLALAVEGLEHRLRHTVPWNLLYCRATNVANPTPGR